MSSLSIYRQQPLALATSQIHRSRSLNELQNAFLTIVPKFVDADAYGLYIFDENLETRTVISHQANHKFLAEYELIRQEDPLFKFLLQKRKFTHSLAMFNQSDWLRQPLHEFLSRWGLDYSIEAPLSHDGNISGTLNFAIAGNRYFAKENLATARFLCSEFDLAYKRILEFEQLKNELKKHGLAGNTMQKVPKRARQVLELLVSGLNNYAISERMGISENTVRHHVKHIYKILGVHNRAQLTKYVFAEKLNTESNLE
jgi:DNA-binding CsgD family transcriptional regulator